MDNDIKRRRSRVRIWVTYMAAAFIFGVGSIIIGYDLFFAGGKPETAKDTFNIILPIGTAVVTYWFAGRSAEKARESTDQSPEGQDTTQKDANPQ